jgi:hypothetical protein
MTNIKTEYIKKVETILSDESKFKLIENPSQDIITKLEDSLNSKLLEIKDKHETFSILDENGKYFKPLLIKKSISQKIYDQIRSTGAKSAVCYGLTKVHKSNYPVRPIISTIGTYNYSTAKYLSVVLENNFNSAKLINQNIDKNVENALNLINETSGTFKPSKQSFAYAIKDTFDFINKISTLKLEKDDYIISFDVESLFTNVPIDETVEIIKNTCFRKKTGKHIKGESNYEGDLDGMRWEHFENLLRRCLQESVFTFNKKLYKQIDGVSMGSPLGPIIANIFMNDFENKHMKELKKLGVRIWYRYVDDTFVIIRCKDQAEKILEFLNNQHPTIKFTMETLNKQLNSELFTLIIRNVQLENSITRDIQKYVKNKKPYTKT